MNTQHYKLYYSFLSLITLGMVCYTVVVSGNHVSYGQRIAELEAQQRTIAEQRTTFTQALAQEQALAQVTDLAQTAGFVPVTHTLTAVHSGIVASR